MSTFTNGGAPPRVMDDDSDVEEEALAADYREQVQYEGMDELEQVNSMSMAQQTDDIQSRLAAAAQPLDFSAPLEVKFASYDNYCSLFHFILNSEGPVDLEPPSVRGPADFFYVCLLNSDSTTGPGMSSTSSSTNSTLSARTETVLRARETMRRRLPFCGKHQIHGDATAF